MKTSIQYCEFAVWVGVLVWAFHAIHYRVQPATTYSTKPEVKAKALLILNVGLISAIAYGLLIEMGEDQLFPSSISLLCANPFSVSGALFAISLSVGAVLLDKSDVLLRYGHRVESGLWTMLVIVGLVHTSDTIFTWNVYVHRIAALIWFLGVPLVILLAPMISQYRDGDRKRLKIHEYSSIFTLMTAISIGLFDIVASPTQTVAKWQFGLETLAAMSISVSLWALPDLVNVPIPGEYVS